MKLVLAGLWVTAVALGTAYGVAIYLPGAGAASAKPAAAPVVLQSQKTRVINVPIVVDGTVHGFVAVQFVFTEDSALLKTFPVGPDVYLLDEAFRTLYSDTKLDPDHIERYDLQKLTAHLVQSTNERLGAPLVKDVLIENFAYIDKDSGKT